MKIPLDKKEVIEKKTMTNVKFESIKRMIIVFLVILFAMLTVALLPKLIPTSEDEANAEIEFEVTRWNDGECYIFLKCSNCGHEYWYESTDEPGNTDEREGFEEWELDTPYCRHCYKGHLCEHCHKEKNDCAEGFCDKCDMCFDCWDWDKHCQACCKENTLCDECLEGGTHRCLDCHSDTSHCPDCGRCLYPLHKNNAVCVDYGDAHCTTCDEPFLCKECCKCFFNDRSNFCDQCEMCLECAVSAKEHCNSCKECLQCTDICSENEGVCLACCIAEGFHCVYCLEHVDDNWCVGGSNCCHCSDCAEEFDWICEQCGRCHICDGFQFCEECDYCKDCCKEAAEATGCECLEYCVQSEEFEDPEHMCPNCNEHFTCEGEEFCESCGYCKVCCEAFTDEYGCVCGLCVESGDFEEHICPNCGEPTCIGGDICSDCEFCSECCLENSEAEDCSCGMCIVDPGFYEPWHLCSECGDFSCNKDFCFYCEICVDCCEEITKSFGCKHGICEKSDDWALHYCTACESCKEDCECGESCCGEPAGAEREVHGTAVPIGTILLQPTSKIRAITSENIMDRADNAVTFSVRAYDPYHTLNYQWYQKIEGETPDMLVNESKYIESTDTTLVFVGGVDTNKLTISVPCDCCVKAYYYYCIITTEEGEEYESDWASLSGRHVYEWVWQNSNTHAYACIGCKTAEEDTAKAHEIGPWHYQYYATAKYGARLVRECRVCGGISDSITTEPLGYHPYHAFIYQPVYGTDYKGNDCCLYHEKACRCGYKEAKNEPHNWDGWVVVTPADEKHKGLKYRDCLTCNYRETVEIPKQTHEHIYTLHSYEEEGQRIYTDSMYHWQYCADPDCNALAFKEEHFFSDWQWVSKPYLDRQDAQVKRVCTVCGYKETRRISEGHVALAFTNADIKTKGDIEPWGRQYVTQATAQPPTGYYFDHWEVIGGEIDLKSRYVLVDGAKVEKQYTLTDPYIEFTLKSSILWFETLYQIKAVCYRYDNNLIVYPNGDYLGANASAYNDTIKVESITEDEYGVRTMTIRLHGYKGGALEVDDTGLSCNLHIIVDKDSTITTGGEEGILGCASGGNIRITSENNATLTIKVKNRDAEECYGIRTQRSKAWCEDKIIFDGNVHVFIEVTSTGSQGVAVGLYTKTWVEVLGQAQLYIQAYSWACPEEKTVTAMGINAGKEVQLDTTNRVEIDVSDVVDGKKGQGIRAKNIIIDEVEFLSITFANSRSGYNVFPTFDPKRMVVYSRTWEDGMRKCTTIEHGCEVIFDIGDNVSVDVEEWYQTEYGTYLVTEDEGLFFSVTPALGYYDVKVYLDGRELKPLESKDGVTKEYVIEMVDGDKKIQISSGVKFDPYASQPGVSKEKIYSGSDAVVSFRLNNVIDALIDHAKLGGEKATNPKYKAEMGKYSEGELITNNFTINKIFLQRYNESIDKFVNTNYYYVPSVVGDVRFNDSYKNVGKTVKYRLMIVFDGEEYPSEEFSITWTNDPNDMVEEMLSVVELHIKHATAGYDGGVCDGGDAWIRLDATNEYYVYDVDINKGYACSKSEYLRKWKKEHLLKVAEFDYHTGILVLYGNGYSYDFDNNGIKEVYDLSGEILDIRASDHAGSEGGLIIDIRGDTTIGGNFDAYGYQSWYDSKGKVMFTDHSYAQEAVILNETKDGFVRVISSNAKENAPYSFLITRTGGESGKMEMRKYCGIKASGDISIEGNMQVTVFINIDADITENKVFGEGERYGLYTPENVIVRGNGHLSCNTPLYNTSLCLQGFSEGIHAGKEVTLLDDANVYIEAGAYRSRPHDPYYALTAETLNVVGNATLELTVSEQITTAVCVNEALIATTGYVKINATDGEIKKYGFNCNEGVITVQTPSTFKMSAMSDYDFVNEEAQIVFDGTFVYYHMDEHNYMPSADSYYAGVPYTITVPSYSELGYDFAEYHTVIKTPAPDLYLITEIDIGEFEEEERFSLDVRYGDSVRYVASEPKKGYRFDGWEIICPVSVNDIVRDGLAITFTMPDCDITLRPKYVCTAFSDEYNYFVVKEEDSLHGELYWEFEAGDTLGSAYLEYLKEDGEWYSLFWSLDEESDDYQVYANGTPGMKKYSGVQKIKLEGEDGEGAEISKLYTTFRINVYCTSGEEEWYWIISKPFEIDFVNGAHVLLGDDVFSPDLTIPSDYIGTEYTIDLSEYVYSGAGMTYEVVLRDMEGALSNDICKVTLDESIITFARNGVHSAISAVENFTYIIATDKATGKSFRIPYNFGEISDSESYPVIVNGKRAISHNKDDILGDGGSVSYDPETKTLTLNNATLTELYSETSDGEGFAGGYAIMAVQNINIRLVGKNTIKVGPYSYCYNKPSHSAFNGKIIAIGNVSNSEKWNSYLTGSDTQRITFTGEGSLEITVKGQNSMAVRSLKNIEINSGEIIINAEENGLTSERGNVVVNGGKVIVDAKKKSCVDIKYGAGHFQVWGGVLELNGGSDDYVIAMNEEGYSNSIYFDKGEIVLKTKSATYDLSNRTLNFDDDLLTYYLEGDNLVQGEPELTHSYVKMTRDFFVWVNGECFAPDKLSIECGNGTATFDPETNTLTLKNATINKGITYYKGRPYASGIYSEEPITVQFVGSCTIDLSKHDFYNYTNGEKVDSIEEEEEYLQVYGIHISNLLYGSHDYTDCPLTLTGKKCKILGVDEGIETSDSVILDGAEITVTGCMVGISAGDGLVLKSGALRIETCDEEYAYAVYGDIDVEDSYLPISIFGTNGGDLVVMNLADIKTQYGDGWGSQYRSLWIRDEEDEVTIYHDWDEPDYVWSEDGKSVTATRVCKNDSDHIETETVEVSSAVSKNPSCDELGETTYGAVFVSDAFAMQTKTLADIAMIAHTEEEPAVENEIPASCSDEGSYDEVVYCAVCGAELSRVSRVIPLLPHDWDAPTYVWSEDGKSATATRICKNDSAHTETETVNVLSNVTKQPSCSEKGQTTYTTEAFVNSAFAVQTRTLTDVAMIAHTEVIDTAVQATCTETGKTAGKHCSVCNAVLVAQEDTPMIAHIPSEVVRENEVVSTCSANGSYDEVTHCVVCDREIMRETKYLPIDADAHDWGDWTMTKVPTETEEGEKTRVCNHNHAHTERRTVASLGHSVLVEITEESASEGVDVKSLFTMAREENKEVMISVGGVEVTFDGEAVNTIGENANITFSLSASDEVTGEMEGTQKVLNITVTGFTAGKSKITVPLDTTVPDNQIAKVYYVDAEGNRTDMNATIVDGNVVFETTHFSKYIIVFENKPVLEPEPETEPMPTDAEEGHSTLSGGAIAGIVVGCVGFVCLVGVAVFILLKKKKRH